VNSRFGRFDEQHEFRETIAGSRKMNKPIASRARTPSLRTRPPWPRLERRIPSHHEIGARLAAGDEPSHELDREAMRLLRTIAAAPATAAA
jgi:hypothetical protein